MTDKPSWLPALCVVPTLILKNHVRDHFGWSEDWAFTVALVAMMAVLGSVRIYLYIRSRKPDQISN